MQKLSRVKVFFNLKFFDKKLHNFLPFFCQIILFSGAIWHQKEKKRPWCPLYMSWNSSAWINTNPVQPYLTIGDVHIHQIKRTMKLKGTKVSIFDLNPSKEDQLHRHIDKLHSYAQIGPLNKIYPSF